MNQFLELAKRVLEKSETPLTYQEIWQKAIEQKLAETLKTKGKTPWQTLGAQLFVDVKDNEDSGFVKVGKRPAKFFLKTRIGTISAEVLVKSELAAPPSPMKEKSKYSERELHPLVSYFAYTNLKFNRGKSVLTKTIYHEKSRKDGLSEWAHPDIVGVYIPIDDWKCALERRKFWFCFEHKRLLFGNHGR